MNATQGSGGFLWRRAWRIARWPLGAILLAYIALVIYRIPAVDEQKHTAEAVAAIQAQKLTMADVDGTHLPPPPDPSQVDATIAGIDANGNGIRDDVELAIFKKYPGQSNIKIRAAELQYAMELQLEFTNVFNVDTWRALALFEDNGISCLVDLAFQKFTNTRDQISKSTEWEKEVEFLVFNTSAREQKFKDAQRYESSFVTSGKEGCDIDLSSLSN